jgi:ABC-2 type transport system permease protein
MMGKQLQNTLNAAQRWLRKYAAFARVGFARSRAEPAELYGRVFLFFVILGVFSALWHAVPLTRAAAGGDAGMLVWYIAMTEWVLLSAPLVQFQIEDEIRRGDVAYQIARPVSYLGAHFALGVGALAARVPVLFATAMFAGWIFTGGAPGNPAGVGRAVLFGIAGTIVIMAYNVVLGLGAFWLGDIAPVYWIWQKLTFVLGGLLLPLSFYPEIVVRIARLTPFSAVLTGPASFVLDRPFFGQRVLAAALVGWMGVAMAAGALAFRRATRNLQLNGG